MYEWIHIVVSNVRMNKYCIHRCMDYNATIVHAARNNFKEKTNMKNKQTMRNHGYISHYLSDKSF